MHKDKFELGMRVKCKVTGFTGIAIAHLKYINGCIQYGVQPAMGTDGKNPDTVYKDQETLEYVDEGIYVSEAPTPKAYGISAPGGPDRSILGAHY